MTPSEIKPGMKFGHWTVIKFSHKNKHRVAYFLCECDCGTQRAVRGTALISGSSKACSRQCLNDIVGTKVGKWTVLKRDKSRPGYYWCRCDCGTERSVIGNALRYHKSMSCGCGKNIVHGIKSETADKYRQYIGQRFGDLTIISSDDTNGTYFCKCKCGNEITAKWETVINGNTTSCGCKRQETLKENLMKKYQGYIGKKINKLTILDVFYKNNNFWFTCQCDCGKDFTALATKIVQGYYVSCGCIKSKAEEEMAKILAKNNISFKREYKFDDCRDKAPLPFDFAIFNSEDELVGLMELNGQQHYIEGGWNTKQHLEYVQKHDRMKHSFCLRNEIPLLVIPYQFYDELEKFLYTSDFWILITENFND